MLFRKSVSGLLKSFDKTVAALNKHAEASRARSEKVAIKTEKAKAKFERKLVKLDDKEAAHSIEALNAEAAAIRIKRAIFGEEPPVVTIVKTEPAPHPVTWIAGEPEGRPVTPGYVSPTFAAEREAAIVHPAVAPRGPASKDELKDAIIHRHDEIAAANDDKTSDVA